ncbi:50S ribosomal protein L10e [uncultured archaeon]|nr:50S ribosomal protein L10e [uncultured archaeon]
MGLRKASCYSKRPTVPYTRKSKVKNKSYIKTIPNTHLTKMRMGDISRYQAGKFPIVLSIKAKHRVQLRDNATEACRQFLNRFLVEGVGKDFYLEVKPYPHHIMRENKMLTGAGADRMQTGMALSFGKATGRASLIRMGETIFVIGVTNPKHEALARKLVGSIRARMPCPLHIDTVYNKI